MSLRVEFDRLDYVTKSMNRDKSDLEIEIKRLKDSLERVKTVWSGPDFEKFYDKAFPYINRMDVLCGFIDATSSFITGACDQYKHQDEAFSKELDKENDKEEILDEQRKY